MPEEINRIVTDHLSEFLFTTEASANENLRKEGIAEEKIHFVGNCMIDTLLHHVERAVEQRPWIMFDLEPNSYSLLTLHRPGNVDHSETLADIIDLINGIAETLPVIFPVHPRTRKQIDSIKIPLSGKVRLCEPLPYLSFLGLMGRARFVMTDSGGIQEETTVLGTPCLTLRHNTERPSTVTCGTNRLVGTDQNKVLKAVEEILSSRWHRGKKPPFWDGQAARRVIDVIETWIAGN